MTKPTKSSLAANSDTVYTVGLIAAVEGIHKSDVVLNTLEMVYPKFFGIEGKECISVDEDAAQMLKAIAYNEQTTISEIIRRGLKNTYSEYLKEVKE